VTVTFKVTVTLS